MPTFEDWQWSREYDKATQNEARFLELASRPGMEALRRECPCPCHHQSWRTNPKIMPCNGCWTPLCLGIVPLPAAERMGALVRVAQKIRGDALFSYWESDPEPEVALTEALLSATEEGRAT